MELQFVPSHLGVLLTPPVAPVNVNFPPAARFNPVTSTGIDKEPGQAGRLIHPAFLPGKGWQFPGQKPKQLVQILRMKIGRRM